MIAPIWAKNYALGPGTSCIVWAVFTAIVDSKRVKQLWPIVETYPQCDLRSPYPFGSFDLPLPNLHAIRVSLPYFYDWFRVAFWYD